MSYQGPSIDHSLLSPSGKCSQRAREAALKREAARLFPPGFWDQAEPTPEARAAQEVIRLRRSAATLREMAARGMNAKRYTREAAQLETEANLIEGKIKTP